MGKSSGGSSSASEAATFIDMSNYLRAQPIQKSVYNRLGNFMAGDLDVSQSPVWQAGKLGAENSYQSGMDSLLNSMPAGGALYSGAADLEGNRANSLTQLMAQIASDEYNKAYGIATGDPQQSASGLAQIGQAQDAQSAAEAASANQTTGQAASAAASIATIIAMMA